MARYCFYCGRELKTGEKCSCRQQRTASSAQSGAESDSKTDNSQSGSYRASQKKSRPSGRPDTSWQEKLRSFYAGYAGKSSYRHSQPRHRQTQTRRQSDNRLSQAMKVVGSYMARPAQQIRMAAQADSRQPVIPFVLFHCLAGGLLLLFATENNRLADLLSLNFINVQQGHTPASRLFILMQGLSVFLASFLLLVILYQFILRYVLRRPIGFVRLLTGLSPACFYSGIFLLLSALLVRSSFFSAILTLMAAFAVHILAQGISLPAITGLDDNRVFILQLTVLLIFTGIISLILNLALPVIDALLRQVIII